ncbi:MAG: methyltransferase domain-containing protein, partial [Roseiflexaceae bacterium]
MSLPDYEYKGLMAQSWDLLRGDTSTWPDRLFYLNLIQTFGQPVLDVGCGTGRLLLDYLAQGIDIDGVDNSPDMLALCRHKAATLGLAPTLYQQYLETLSLPRQYRTIIIPSSTLQLVIDPALAVQSLQRLAAHLVPGGIVVAPFMTVWKAGDPLSWEWEQSAIRDAQLRRYLRYKEGEPYDAGKLLRTQFALDDSQFFSNVEVTQGERDRVAHTVPVNISAKTARNTYSIAAGY